MCYHIMKNNILTLQIYNNIFTLQIFKKKSYSQQASAKLATKFERFWQAR